MVRNFFVNKVKPELERRREGEQRRTPPQQIKGVSPLTAALANGTGRGRVGRHAMAKGQMAIIPNNLTPSMPEPAGRRPVGRSFVGENGIYDANRIMK